MKSMNYEVATAFNKKRELGNTVYLKLKKDSKKGADLKIYSFFYCVSAMK